MKRSGVTRRAKLYYLRERTGKAVRLKERRTHAKKVAVLRSERLPEHARSARH